MMAMTTSSSTSVNAVRGRPFRERSIEFLPFVKDNCHVADRRHLVEGRRERPHQNFTIRLTAVFGQANPARNATRQLEKITRPILRLACLSPRRHSADGRGGRDIAR